MRVIRWGIIGVGDVTEVKSGPGFRKADHSALVAVMRRDGGKARDYARRHDVPRWYDDAAALIADPEVDAVYIATPPDTHRAYTVMAAAAGKPVLVEKPMALTLGQCEAMNEACRAAGVPLFVAYYRRTMPRFVEIERLIEAGAIGTPRAVLITHLGTAPAPGFDRDGMPWRFRPEAGGGGKFVDTGVHILDYLDHVFGPIADVRAIAGNQAGLYPAEDTVTCTFSFAECPVIGTGMWCYAADRHEEFTRIIGSRGQIGFSCFDGQVPVILSVDGETRELPLGWPDHVHQPLIQSIVDELNGIGHCPSTGETAMRTAAVVDKILADRRRQTGVLADDSHLGGTA